jgi:hypothetical protein
MPTVVMLRSPEWLAAWAAMRLAASVDAVVGLGQRQAQPAGKPGAEAFAGHDGDLLVIEEGPAKALARQAGGADVDQGEHPRLGPVDAQAADPVQRPGDDSGAAREAVGHAVGNRRRFGNCKFGHVRNEGLAAKKHGF